MNRVSNCFYFFVFQMAKNNQQTSSLSKVFVNLKKEYPDLNYDLLPQLGFTIDYSIKESKVTLKDLNIVIKLMNLPILEPFKKALESLLENRKMELEKLKTNKNEKKKIIEENLSLIEDEQETLGYDIERMLENMNEEDVDDIPSDLTKLSEILPEKKSSSKRKINVDSGDSDSECDKKISKKRKAPIKKKKNLDYCAEVLEALDSDDSYKSLDADEYVLNFKKNNVKWWTPYAKDDQGHPIPLCHCKRKCQKKVSVFSKEKELMCRGNGKKKCDMRFNQKTFYKFVKFMRKMGMKSFPIPKCTCKDLCEDTSVIVKGSSEKSPNLSFWYFCMNCRNLTYVTKVWSEIEKVKNFQKDDSDSDSEEESTASKV